jgi:mRNA-degrading endonuclease toxin of MazEF toxin-antitoxin module
VHLWCLIYHPEWRTHLITTSHSIQCIHPPCTQVSRRYVWAYFISLVIYTMQKTPETFNEWNNKAQEIEFLQTNESESRVWQVLWYYEGINIGNEISKDGNMKRPCIILHKQWHTGLVLIAPITSKYHNWMQKYLIPVQNYEKYGLRESWIVMNQIRLISPKRLLWVLQEHTPSISFAQYVIWYYKSLF